ncbi:MAG: hypothetical protein BWY21_01941 [Parcubacteria group bacterium ADurb.Bin216]|nr:MAG: hypothetical protein BWY21_01941 [Parcubacteria group bacterium ADurb.Bin216]
MPVSPAPILSRNIKVLTASFDGISLNMYGSLGASANAVP